MKATAKLTREEKVERFVYRVAIESLIANLAHLFNNDTGRLLEEGDRDRLVAENDSSDDLASAVLDGLWTDLWPEVEDLETEEHAVANLRAMIHTATVFARIAESPDYFRAESKHYLKLAARDAEALATRAGDA